MLKKCKRIIASFLVIFIFCSANIFANSKTLQNFDISKMISALNSAEKIKGLLNLSDVDFSKLTYSSPIIAYDYSGTDVSVNSRFIPILYYGKLVGWVIYTDEGVYQFSTAFIDRISNYDIYNKEFAIIYTVDKCYLYNGDTLYTLATIPFEIENRGYIENVESIADLNIILNSVDKSHNLNYTSTSTFAAGYYTCNISKVLQSPYNKLCWAASVACVVNKLQSKSLTAAAVAINWYGTNNPNNFNVAISEGGEVNVLKKYGVAYTYRRQNPADGIISNNIHNGYPVLATFRWLDGSVYKYHMGVIYGIDIFKGNIYIMDPGYGFCSTNGHSYISSATGKTMTLFGASCKYWTS